MDLATAADIAQVLSLLTLAGGGAAFFVQSRNAHQQRADQAAYEFLALWDTQIADALDRVYALPEGTPFARIDGDPELRRAALSIDLMMERLGILVHGRQVRLQLVDAWAGGAVRLTWRKLRPWVDERRARTGSQRPAEWFQWLVERLEQHTQRDETVGAQTAFAKWRP